MMYMPTLQRAGTSRRSVGCSAGDGAAGHVTVGSGLTSTAALRRRASRWAALLLHDRLGSNGLRRRRAEAYGYRRATAAADQLALKEMQKVTRICFREHPRDGVTNC